jgi:hypothetical protein
MANPTSKIEVKRSDRAISPKGRCSYPHLFKPSAFQGEGEPKYSVSLIVTKDAAGKAFIAKIKELQAAAIKELYGAKMPQNFETWGVSEGGEEDPTTKGCWIVKGSNKNRPAVIDARGTQILDELELYGGCYGRINVNAKAYGAPAKGGVTLELNVFQKIEDGEPFGGAEKAKQAAVTEMGAYEEAEAF